jgi:hypothetical protein
LSSEIVMYIPEFSGGMKRMAWEGVALAGFCLEEGGEAEVRSSYGMLWII